MAQMPSNKPIQCPVPWTVYAAVAIIATGGLLFGYIIGINSNVVTEGQLLCPTGWTGAAGTWTSYGYGQCWQLSDLTIGVLSSMNLIGALVSSIFCFQFGDVLGRKREIQIGSVLYFAGSMTAALSPTLWGVFTGFAIYGLGIGFAMHAAPVYIAEVCPAEVRGTMVSAKEAAIVLGIVFGYGMGAIFASETDGWRWMAGGGGVFALAMCLGAACLHRSPRWLVLQAVQTGQAESALLQEARLAMQFFRDGSPEEVESELQKIRSEATAAAKDKPADWKETFAYPKPLIIGWGLVTLQQVTGQPSVLYNATNIFKSAGFTNTATLSSFGVGVVKLMATLVTVWRVDQFGRKQLLFWGIGLMTVALAILAFAFTKTECLVPEVPLSACPDDMVSLPQAWGWATVVALMVYVSGYQLGFGPISWVMISEIFPLRVRGAALSTAAVVNFSFNILMNTTQSSLLAVLGSSGTYLAYLLMSLLSLWFVHAKVIETKGLTLEEIEHEMTKGNDSNSTEEALLFSTEKGYGAA